MVQDNVSLMLESIADPQEGYWLVDRGDHRATLKPTMHGEDVYLMYLGVDPLARGNGLASELLQDICAAADEHDVKLWLEVEWHKDDGGLSEQKLLGFFWQHGFRGNKSEMVREPASMR